MDIDFVSSIDLKKISSLDNALVKKIFETEMDIYCHSEEGFGPDSQIIEEPSHYKINFTSVNITKGISPNGEEFEETTKEYEKRLANEHSVRNQLWKQFVRKLLKGGNAVIPMFFRDDPVTMADLYVYAEDIENLKYKKPKKLMAALNAQNSFPKGKDEDKGEIEKWLGGNHNELSETTRGIIATMVRKDEVKIAEQVWKKLYLGGKNKSPKFGHVALIKGHLKGKHDIEEKSNKAKRIAEIINPNPKGGAPKTG